MLGISLYNKQSVVQNTKCLQNHKNISTIRIKNNNETNVSVRNIHVHTDHYIGMRSVQDHNLQTIVLLHEKTDRGTSDDDDDTVK